MMRILRAAPGVRALCMLEPSLGLHEKNVAVDHLGAARLRDRLLHCFVATRMVFANFARRLAFACRVRLSDPA